MVVETHVGHATRRTRVQRILQKGGQGVEFIRIGQCDGHGGIARFFDFGIGGHFRRPHIKRGLVTGHAADFVVEVFATLGITRRHFGRFGLQ